MALAELTRGRSVRHRDTNECLAYVGPVSGMPGSEAFLDTKGLVRIIGPADLNGRHFQVLPVAA